MSTDIYQKCMLLLEQRTVIREGIRKGFKRHQLYLELFSDIVTDTSIPKNRYDLVNTEVTKSIENNPHLQIEFEKKKSGFHPYIVLREKLRNISILVLPLATKKDMFDSASTYRKNFSVSNIPRLIEEGLPEDSPDIDIQYQRAMHPLGTDNYPFGLIVAYDPYDGSIREGALMPDHTDWIFLENTTSMVLDDIVDNVRTINVYEDSEDIKISFKETAHQTDEDIPLKLKSDPSV
ncbi:hypothetical protein [Paenibacillus agri]|uniref:Uncharacterized protein n=1 Tax=Paenibacillus agri TaxID=2744309 RepID=A0A850ENK2_9BACL|nr:hypothetical protein [Paenibacillus agri]NUU61117.1 hypothetical protein [Paenibacillus agri]